MKNITFTLLLIIFAGSHSSEKNNHLTFSITNRTDLNFYVHTSGINENSQSNDLTKGELPPEGTYCYHHAFSCVELSKYTNFDFIFHKGHELRPWKKWFSIVHSTGQNVVIDILLAHFNSKQALKTVVHNLKPRESTIEVRQDPNAIPFNIAIHLMLKSSKSSMNDFLLSDDMGFSKMDLVDSTIEITEISK